MKQTTVKSITYSLSIFFNSVIIFILGLSKYDYIDLYSKSNGFKYVSYLIVLFLIILFVPLIKILIKTWPIKIYRFIYLGFIALNIYSITHYLKKIDSSIFLFKYIERNEVYLYDFILSFIFVVYFVILPLIKEFSEGFKSIVNALFIPTFDSRDLFSYLTFLASFYIFGSPENKIVYDLVIISYLTCFFIRTESGMMTLK